MRTRLAVVASALAMLALSALPARGHVLIFQDGFTLTGRLFQPGQWHQGFWMSSGSIALDTDCRRILFSHQQVLESLDKDLVNPADVIKLERIPAKMRKFNMYPIHHVLEHTPWDEKWQRTFRMEVGGRPKGFRQRLAVLTPYFAKVSDLDYIWDPCYMTSELGPDVVRGLLDSHPDTKLTGKKEDADRRFKRARFFELAGWYDVAGEELDAVLKDFPGEKKKVDAAQDRLAAAKAVRRYDQIDLAHQAGRHRWAQEQLKGFPREHLDERAEASLRALRTEYEAANRDLSDARRLLKDLPGKVPAAVGKDFRDAAAAVLDELTYETVGRLAPFLGQALQAERDAKANRKPANDPGQLLSLAVSGWLLGKEFADTKPEAALRLWKARQLVHRYQVTHTADDRKELLKEYEDSTKDALRPDELAQLIALLPPPEPEKATGTDPVSRTTNLPWGRRKGISYLLQLPPEFHRGRPYPVLIALHHAREKPRDMVERLAPVAADHGYILAAPEWAEGPASVYGFSAAEHDAVLDVLRDLRRLLPVDSDRVFLVGLGEGANMAFDLGLSHPDQFAGIIPVNGHPHKFGDRYNPNAQDLPFYVVEGEWTVWNSKENESQTQFRRWLPAGYPAIYVQYKGRGLEWFDGEVPTLFEWMDKKKDRGKRAAAVPELGRAAGSLNQDFQTMRATDNHFYWLSSDAINDRHLNELRHWRPEAYPASFYGRVFRENNQINVRVSGLKQVTVWLARDMIDFSKPLTVRLNGAPVWLNRKAYPSRSTLLEDFYRRGDRQRLFLARLDFNL